jgi:hypothetical protein
MQGGVMMIKYDLSVAATILATSLIGICVAPGLYGQDTQVVYGSTSTNGNSTRACQLGFTLSKSTTGDSHEVQVEFLADGLGDVDKREIAALIAGSIDEVAKQLTGSERTKFFEAKINVIRVDATCLLATVDPVRIGPSEFVGGCQKAILLIADDKVRIAREAKIGFRFF